MPGLADGIAQYQGSGGQEAPVNVLLYGRSATHRGTGPDTYSSQLIGALAGRCNLGEYATCFGQLGDWDVVQVLDMKHVTMGFVRRMTLPVVLDVHDTYWLDRVSYPALDRWARRWLNWWRRRKYPKMMARAARIVVHSRFVAAILQEYLPVDHIEKIAYVPYAVTVPDEPEEEIPSHKPRILFAGRDFFRKGLSVLLDAFELLLNRLPDCELAVVGQEYYHSLRWAVRRCRGLPVRFLGGLSPRDLHREIRGSDVVVLPSYTEAFGIVLLEAQALGVPVVGTRVGGIPETMEDGATGLLVPPGDPGSLAEALEGLLNDPDRRREMGVRGKEWVAREYSPQRMAEALITVYSDVIGSLRLKD
jgi:glycosyltransferase involved in cell wall biosynthesis